MGTMKEMAIREMNEQVKPEVGQIWRQRGGTTVVFYDDNPQIRYLAQKRYPKIDITKAKWFTNGIADYGQNGKFDLIAFVEWCDGYGPQPALSNVVKTSEGATGTITVSSATFEAKLFTDAELHAKDGLTPTDRRLRDERVERERIQSAEVLRRETLLKLMVAVENERECYEWHMGACERDDYAALVGREIPVR